MAERIGKNLPSQSLVAALDSALGAQGELVALRKQAKSDQLALRRRATDQPPAPNPVPACRQCGCGQCRCGRPGAT
jgi:hypothetical protein